LWKAFGGQTLPFLCGAVDLLTGWLHVFVESEGRELGERRKKNDGQAGLRLDIFKLNPLLDRRFNQV
jgi:hypothetical protein